jgi:hypothetical protein
LDKVHLDDANGVIHENYCISVTPATFTWAIVTPSQYTQQLTRNLVNEYERLVQAKATCLKVEPKNGTSDKNK